MVLPSTTPILLNRNVLYTGITRAKKLLIVIGMPKLVETMIGNAEIRKRITGLEYKMRYANFE